ncbi:hypothetical protein ABTY59_32080 [Streptomyces sp. NPDC096079]|uniref:hypothetical protein n=1 Tax=Streptomyces sp. NPDC096079 TaxID=3155820 RepID=UPI0033232058
MSTAAPASAPAEEQPFDPTAFPADLRAARLRANALYAEQHTFSARLPWSREPHPGWEPVLNKNNNTVIAPGREASPGWDADDAAAYDRLGVELREVTAAIQMHPWWATCRENGVTGLDIVQARQALKALTDAAPLQQDDVEKTA